ncbi:hypothetical protein Tco_1076764, partial [Tanacetum coccineum]
SAAAGVLRCRQNLH